MSMNLIHYFLIIQRPDFVNECRNLSALFMRFIILYFQSRGEKREPQANKKMCKLILSSRTYNLAKKNKIKNL